MALLLSFSIFLLITYNMILDISLPMFTKIRPLPTLGFITTQFSFANEESLVSTLKSLWREELENLFSTLIEKDVGNKGQISNL